MNFNELRSRAEDFAREVSLEYYMHFSGQKDEFSYVEIVDKYPDLHDRATLDFVRSLSPGLTDAGKPVAGACAGAVDATARELDIWRAYFTFTYLSEAVKEDEEKLANDEAAATVPWNGEDVAYRFFPVKIANEPSHDARVQMTELHNRAMDGMNPLRRAMMEKTLDLTKSLGYLTHTDLCVDAFKLPLDEVTALGGEFQSASIEYYKRELARVSERDLGLPLSEVSIADTGYLFRAPKFDAIFPKERLIPAVKKTFAGLGVDMDAQKNITLDVESRPKKSPRAFCISISVPNDVRLVVLPKGGQEDYRASLHESGHLEFSANMNDGLSFAFKELGDTSVHEMFAFLFEYLTLSPVWLRTVLGAAGEAQAYIDFNRFAKLMMLRRYFAKLEYERAFYEDNTVDGKGDLYSDTLTKRTLIKYDPRRYLSDFDGGYYSCKYLVAWMAETMLRHYLVERFDENWFEKRAAGDFLRGLWKGGLAPRAWELVKTLGYKGLTVEYLLKDTVG